MIHSIRYQAKRQSNQVGLETSILSRSFNFVRGRILLVYFTAVEILYMFYK